MTPNTQVVGVFLVGRSVLRSALFAIVFSGCAVSAEEQVLRDKRQIEENTYTVEDRQIEATLHKQDFPAALEEIHSAQHEATADVPRQQYLLAKERAVKHDYIEYLIESANVAYQHGDLPAALKLRRAALVQEPSEPLRQPTLTQMAAELTHCQKLYGRAEAHLQAKRWRKAKDDLDAPELTRFAASFGELNDRRRTASVALAEETIDAARRALKRRDLAGTKKVVAKCKLDWARSPEALAKCSLLDDQIGSREVQSEAKKALQRGAARRRWQWQAWRMASTRIAAQKTP